MMHGFFQYGSGLCVKSMMNDICKVVMRDQKRSRCGVGRTKLLSSIKQDCETIESFG